MVLESGCVDSHHRSRIEPERLLRLAAVGALATSPLSLSHIYRLSYLTLMTPKVLVVCLGNICRSPMGEAVLRKIAKDRDIDIVVDSAGTAAYHVDEEPDER